MRPPSATVATGVAVVRRSACHRHTADCHDDEFASVTHRRCAADYGGDGLAFALAAGELAATAPGRFLGLAVDGLGVAALVLSVTLVEQALALMQRGNRYGIALLLAGAVIGVLILLAATFVQRRHAKPEKTATMLAAGVCWVYLFLPAAHYLFFTDGWFYITTMDNFFPHSWLVFMVGWMVTGLIVALVARMRRNENRP